MNSTERAFSENINAILESSEKVVVAFSGGCDSLALLVLCTKVLGKDRTFPVYVNHRLRAEAELDSEIRLNRENCERLGLDLAVESLDEGEVEGLARKRGGGVEEAARLLRYRRLEKARLEFGASFILTAHHRQDQVETIIMRLSKGSPVTSLKGISPIDRRRHLMRPLLDLSRGDLERYLVDNGFQWSTDSTNSDVCFSRNSIRNDIIPSIQAIWPDYEETVLRIGEQAFDLCQFNAGDIGSVVDISEFDGKTAVQRTIILFSMWDCVFNDKELPFSLLSRVLEAVEKKGDCSIGSNGAMFSIYRGRLYLTDPSADEEFSLFSADLDPAAGNRIGLPDGHFLLSGMDLVSDDPLAIRLDPSSFSGRVRVRFARPGDKVRLKNGAKMVLRLLQDMKIPAHLRCRVPLLEDDDGICAVFGGMFGGRDRISAKFHTSLARNHFPLYIVSKG
ncbi:MAG: tRNA lysidine(34) synthetase TilS [Spirochaetales bacterium]|nr:tRNA lysidine(34) synthetase TilS [Spirochaetales bacterium]